MKWRAWYATSRSTWVVYSSTETGWREIPGGDPDVPEGVVGAVRYLSTTVTPYRQIIDGGDWYWMQDGEIHRVMTAAEWGSFAPAPDVGCLECLKQSGVMDDDAWAEVQREMIAATEAP